MTILRTGLTVLERKKVRRIFGTMQGQVKKG
jgi:hypothetical protein